MVAVREGIGSARRASHPGYLGMLGGSGGCVAARNRGSRPRKIASSRAANSARPPPSREPPVILERFVFVPEDRDGDGDDAERGGEEHGSRIARIRVTAAPYSAHLLLSNPG